MEGETNGRSNEWKVKRMEGQTSEGQRNGRSKEWKVKRQKVKHRGSRISILTTGIVLGVAN